MTTKDFQIAFKIVANKPVKVEYGKSTFQNITLTEYNEKLGVVRTSMSGELNIRAIKKITLLSASALVSNEPQNEVVEVDKDAVPGLLKDGYFHITGSLGGHWKICELKNKLHLTVAGSPTTLNEDNIMSWISKYKNEHKEAPNILVNDTFCIPEYFKLVKGKGDHWTKQIITQ